MAGSKAWLVLAFAASSMTPLMAQAQTSEVDNAVEEVVVTAQRREQRLVDVPVTISSISADALDRQNVVTIKDLSRVTPSLTVTHNGSQSQPSVRGVNSRTFEGSVAVYVDGVYNPSSVANAADLGEISRVDVLKGPQGTLFGRNATGGAIMIETPNPTQELQVRAMAGLEERNGQEASFYVSKGLSDTIAVNLAVNGRKSDGWVEKGDDPLGNTGIAIGEPLNGMWGYNVRSKLLWTPTDDLRVTLMAEQGSGKDNRGFGRIPTKYTGAIGPVPPQTRNVAYMSFAPDNRFHYADTYLKAQYEAGDYTLSSISAYRYETTRIRLDADLRSAASPNIVAGYNTTEGTFSQEFNVARSGDRLDWVGGLFLYANDIQKKYYTADMLTRLDTVAFAPYFDFTYEITDQLSFTGGLRYSYEKKDFDYQRPINMPTSGPPTAAFTKTAHWDDISPRAVLQYKFDSNSNVYASYSQGFKSGFFNIDATGLTNGNHPAAQAINPESLDAFEVGYKIYRPGWRLATAAFHYDWKNIQVQRYDGTTTITQNAAQGRIYGLEVDAMVDVNEALSISFVGAYTHGRYVDFESQSVNRPVDPSNPNSANSIATGQDVSGKRLIRTPDWTGTLSVDYSVPVPLGELDLTASLFYTSEYATASARFDPVTGEQDLAVPSHTLLNLNARWKFNDHYSFEIYGRNVTDKVYFSDRDAGGLGEYAVWAEPRTFGVRVRYEY